MKTMIFSIFLVTSLFAQDLSGVEKFDLAFNTDESCESIFKNNQNVGNLKTIQNEKNPTLIAINKVNVKNIMFYDLDIGTMNLSFDEETIEGTYYHATVFLVQSHTVEVFFDEINANNVFNNNTTDLNKAETLFKKFLTQISILKENNSSSNLLKCAENLLFSFK